MTDTVLGMRACEDCGKLTRMNSMHMVDPRPFYAKCDACLTEYVNMIQSQAGKK